MDRGGIELRQQLHKGSMNLLVFSDP